MWTSLLGTIFVTYCITGLHVPVFYFCYKLSYYLTSKILNCKKISQILFLVMESENAKKNNNNCCKLMYFFVIKMLNSILCEINETVHVIYK